MCGRTANPFTLEELQKHFSAYGDFASRPGSRARSAYNISPGQFQYVMYGETLEKFNKAHFGNSKEFYDSTPESSPDSRQKDLSEKFQLALREMKWGLIPSWSKTTRMKNTINCRAESLALNSGMWNRLKQKKRCIIPALGYFEWQDSSIGDKTPYFLRRFDKKPLLFAGLYDCAKIQDSKEHIYSYSIITCSAFEGIAWLHDRMPVIIDNEDNKFLMEWLNPQIIWSDYFQKQIQSKFTNLECFPVNKKVGNIHYDSKAFVEPKKEDQPSIETFFKAGKKRSIEDSNRPEKLKSIKKE